MAELFFEDNPTYGMEGVYASEIENAPEVSSVDASAAAFAARTVRGPERVVACSSLSQWVRIYGEGSIVQDGPVISKAWEAQTVLRFGRRYTRRVVDPASVAATFTVGTTLKIDASSKGTWGNAVSVVIANATDSDANHFNATVSWRGFTQLIENADIFGTNDNLASVYTEGDENLVVLTKLTGGRPANGTYALAGGTDGTLTATHYTNAVAALLATEGVTAVCVPESVEDVVGTGAQLTFNLAAGALVNATPDNQLLTEVSGKPANTPAQDITALAGLSAVFSDRFIPFRNKGKVMNPTTGLPVELGSQVFAASVLSQLPPQEHIGSEKGLQALESTAYALLEYTENQAQEDLRAAGINQLVQRQGGRIGFQWARTTSRVKEKGELVDRRVKDVLINSISDANRYFINSTQILENETVMRGNIEGYLESEIGGLLAVPKAGSPVYRVTQTTSETDRKNNRVRFLIAAKIMGHNNFIQLDFQLGVGVLIVAEV